MARRQIVDILNGARARDLAVTIQYMWQHYEAQGLQSPAVAAIFKKVAMEEMRHAERFAKRIVCLGGTPTHTPGLIRKSKDLQAMVADDLGCEDEAIAMCRSGVDACEQGGDYVTRRLFEEILAQSEGHRDIFQTLLGRKGEGP
jgi:bacterioferritin